MSFFGFNTDYAWAYSNHIMAYNEKLCSFKQDIDFNQDLQALCLVLYKQEISLSLRFMQNNKKLKSWNELSIISEIHNWWFRLKADVLQ